MVRFYNTFKFLLLAATLLSALHWSCAERDQRNPFDPNNPTGSAPITVSISANSNSIKVSWTDPDLTDFNGFKLYRESGSDTAFTVIADPLLPTRRSFVDYTVIPGTRYSYYVTIIGDASESKPSNIVSIIPGPGYNWVVDRNAFQVVKLSYDSEHLFFRSDVDPYPEDMAIMKNRRLGLITFPVFGTISTFDLTYGSVQNRLEGIARPFNVIADDPWFWITDSSGALYRYNADDEQIEMIDPSLRHPTSIALDTLSGHVYVTDSKLGLLRIYNADGSIFSTLNSINEHRFSAPKQVAVNASQNRLFFVDRKNDTDYIYSATLPANELVLIDSVAEVSAIDISPASGSAWIAIRDRSNSFVMQLSASGTRQSVISELYNPADVTVNPYDESILIMDSGNYRLLHYNTDLQLIGVYRRFAYPLRVIIE